MNIAEFIQQIQARYHISADYPWMQSPESAVFRHPHNQKWFALAINVKPISLGRNGTEYVEIVNLKAKPEQIGSLRQIKGILPAYHMNKEHWISVVLAEISPNLLWELVEESFYLTLKLPSQAKKRNKDEL